jgi:hypothetical protein
MAFAESSVVVLARMAMPHQCDIKMTRMSHWLDIAGYLCLQKLL